MEQFDLPLSGLTYRERFEKFDRENPKVYEEFKRFAFEAIDAGCTRLSSDFIIQRVRWETSVRTRGAEKFKINSIFDPYYARKFVAEFPQHRDFFEFRRIRTP